MDPLGPDDIRTLIVDALRVPPEEVQSLADLLFDKTGGNPFFTIQFLSTLVDDALLTFDRDISSWRWDVARIRAKGMSNNVADLLAQKLYRLPGPAQEVLKHLACLGSRAPGSTVALLFGLSEDATHSALEGAVRNQLVIAAESEYIFVHDRVREAAYALIPEAERAARHLRIARLLASLAEASLQERIFEVVNHFNRGLALIDSEEERTRLAHFNLIAGRRAKASTAYVAGGAYFAAGLALLVEERSTRHYRSTFDLELGLAECDFLTGDVTAARSRLSTLIPRAANSIDRAAASSLLIVVDTALGQPDQAIEVGLQYLRQEGIEWSSHPYEQEVRGELEDMWRRIGSRPIEALLDLPLMAKPEWRATMDVLQEMVAPAVFTDENLLGLVLTRMISLSVENGNCDASCYAYVSVNMVVGVRFGDFQAGFRFGNLSFDLVETRGLTRYRARVYLGFGSAVIPWTRALSSGRELIQKAFDISRETGDVTFQVYSAENMISHQLAAGDPLGKVLQAANEYVAIAKKAAFGFGIAMISGQVCLVRSLRGLEPAFEVGEKACDELSFEAYLEGHPHLFLPSCWYWIRKLQARFYAEDYSAALEAAAKAEPGLWMTGAYLEAAEYQFYAALTHAATCDGATADQRLWHLEALRSHHGRIATCAESSPENFTSRASLIEAEIARLEGRELDAERLYEVAIRSAHEQGFVQNEGLGNEHAARFHAVRGFGTIADAYAHRAHSCYVKWGADAKVRQLEKTYPHFRMKSGYPGADELSETTAEHLDLETVAKLSQATASEIDLEKLIHVVMKLAIEHAGADRAVLVLVEGDDMSIGAEATTTGEQINVNTVESTSPAELPESILRYVMRTDESLLLADASEPNLFSEDPYFTRCPGRSILCIPMIKQAKLVGQLYLENRQVSHVFTRARQVVLKLLAAQAAVAIEHARLYAGLRKTESALARSRQSERDRIARELHDTLLQSTQGLVMLFHAMANRLSADDPNRKAMSDALNRAEEVMREGRDRVEHLRVATDQASDLPKALAAAAASLAAQGSFACRISVEGIERALEPVVSDEAYRIGHEALLNAFRHAGAGAIEVDVVYAADTFRVRVRDNGMGIDMLALEAMPRRGHWGLMGMRERAEEIGARLDIWSRAGAGTEIELRVPADIAYARIKPRSRWPTLSVTSIPH